MKNMIEVQLKKNIYIFNLKNSKNVIFLVSYVLHVMKFVFLNYENWTRKLVRLEK